MNHNFGYCRLKVSDQRINDVPVSRLLWSVDYPQAIQANYARNHQPQGRNKDAPAVVFDGQNLVFNKKLNFKREVYVPDYLHRILAEIVLSGINDQGNKSSKKENGIPFREDLSDVLQKILDVDYS